jgi:hypothetical protein
MQQRIAVTLLAGIIAGTLPALPHSGLLFSLWAAFLPLLLLGFCEGVRAAVNAGSIAFVLALFMGGGSAAINMGILVLLPTYLLLFLLLQYKNDTQGRIVWYPAMRAFACLTLLPMALFMALSMVSNSLYKQERVEMVRSLFKPDLAAFDPQSADMLLTALNDWGFIVVAFAAWCWLFTVWLLAYIANRLLAGRGQAIRPDITLNHRDLPGWLPALLIVFIGLTAFGSADDAFAGKTVILMLLQAYFVSGMAILHKNSFHWQLRTLWLSCVYVVLICQAWMVIFPCLAGLYFHLSEMLDKRQKIG